MVLFSMYFWLSFIGLIMLINYSYIVPPIVSILMIIMAHLFNIPKDRSEVYCFWIAALVTSILAIITHATWGLLYNLVLAGLYVLLRYRMQMKP